jgi:hypothetical protein
MNQPDVDLSFGFNAQPPQGREIGIIVTVTWNGEMKTLHRAGRVLADRIDHVDNYARIGWLHEMFMLKVAVAEMVSEFDGHPNELGIPNNALHHAIFYVALPERLSELL